MGWRPDAGSLRLRLITEADTNWALVAILVVLAVVMFWAAYQETRKALAR